MPGDHRPNRRADGLALAAIGAVFAVGWVIVAGWQNVPVVDDWGYGWAVEHLLHTGHLVILSNFSCYPIVQILWGALFAWPTGFSFGALRVSTVVLATLGCWAIYLTLRELAFSARVSLLAALTVALYPAFFVLAFSFMTDVPFVSVSAISLYFYVSGARRELSGRLWWGTVFAVAAFLIRQMGVLLPLAAFAAADRRVLSWAAVRRFWLPPAAAGLAIGILWFTLPLIYGRLWVIDNRVASISSLLSMGLPGYISWNLELLWIVAFPFAPLLVCQLTRWRRAFAVAVIALAIFIALRALSIEIPTPLHQESTWSPQSLALSTNLIGGTLTPAAWAVRIAPLLKLAGTIVLAALIVGFPSIARHDWRATRILLAAGLLHLGMINVTWLYYDRYYLVFLPVLAYCAAAPLWHSRLRLWPAVAVLAVWAFISLTGTRYVLAMNAACARMTADLEARGVPPSDINAGYTSNAWRLYAHPENLARNQTLDDVPFVTSERTTRYRIVTTPDPGDDVLRMELLPAAWWQATDRVYLIQRPGAQ